MEDQGSALLRRLIDERSGALLDTHAQHGDATAVVRPDQILEVLAFARDDSQLAFEMLAPLDGPDEARAWVRHNLARGTRFPGFGHLGIFGHQLARAYVVKSEFLCCFKQFIQFVLGVRIRSRHELSQHAR